MGYTLNLGNPWSWLGIDRVLHWDRDSAAARTLEPRIVETSGQREPKADLVVRKMYTDFGQAPSARPPLLAAILVTRA